MLPDMTTGRPLKQRPTAFGQRLAELRKSTGFSQAQLGEKLGFSQRAIASWEMRETTSLRPDQIILLAEVLNVSVDFLITGNKHKDKNRPGPKSQLGEAFENASKLSRKDQKQIVSVVNALVAQANSGS